MRGPLPGLREVTTIGNVVGSEAVLAAGGLKRVELANTFANYGELDVG
jgi:hypothetical protein